MNDVDALRVPDVIRGMALTRGDVVAIRHCDRAVTYAELDERSNRLAQVLLDGSDLFAHVLVDLTGFELLGEHASAAACMDAVALVGRAHRTREQELAAGIGEVARIALLRLQDVLA